MLFSSPTAVQQAPSPSEKGKEPRESSAPVPAPHRLCHSPGSPHRSDTSLCPHTPSATGSPFPSGSLNTEAASPVQGGQQGKGLSCTGGCGGPGEGPLHSHRRDAGHEPVGVPAPAPPHSHSHGSPSTSLGLYLGEEAAADSGISLRGPRGCAPSPAPVPTASCPEPPRALTLCRGAAIRQSSQINSWPVQENRQLSAGDNAAFVLRLQVQGQLPVLHCEGRGDVEKENESHHSGCWP